MVEKIDKQESSMHRGGPRKRQVADGYLHHVSNRYFFQSGSIARGLSAVPYNAKVRRESLSSVRRICSSLWRTLYQLTAACQATPCFVIVLILTMQPEEYVHRQ